MANFEEYVHLTRSNLSAFAVAVVSATLKTFFSNDPYFRYTERVETYTQDQIDPNAETITQQPLYIYEDGAVPEDIENYPVLVIVKGATALRRVGMDDLLYEDLEKNIVGRIAIAESNVIVNCFAPDRMASEYLATNVHACFHFYSDFLRSVFRLHDIEPTMIQRSQTVMGNNSYQPLGDLVPVQINVKWPFTWGQSKMDAPKLQQMFIHFFDSNTKDDSDAVPGSDNELHYTDP